MPENVAENEESINEQIEDAPPEDAAVDRNASLADSVEDDDEDEEEDDESSDEEENTLGHLPDYVLSRVEKLKQLDEKREDIMDTYLAERASLEQKFAELLKPLYDDRAVIVRGEKDNEIADEEAADKPAEVNGGDGADSEGKDDTDARVKGIPQFWICAMTHNETVGEIITEEDVDCLESLRDITCVDDEDGKGFTLRFHFGSNDYFHDAVLTKRYEVPNLLLSDEPILRNVVGCNVQWKPDKSLTFRKVKKKQRGKGKNAGQVRTITKTEEKESFFHWFDPPSMPTMEEMDEEEAEEIEEKFDADYDIAQAFRCHIIPRAVLWFTGEGADQEMLQAMGEMEGLE